MEFPLTLNDSILSVAGFLTGSLVTIYVLKVFAKRVGQPSSKPCVSCLRPLDAPCDTCPLLAVCNPAAPACGHEPWTET